MLLTLLGLALHPLVRGTLNGGTCLPFEAAAVDDETDSALVLRQVRSLSVTISIDGTVAKPAGQGLMKGIGYSPSPLVKPGTLPDNDFFGEEARPQWGPEGRGDLLTMKAMGANTVRLYGNNPRLHHHDFLDYAHSIGLDVIPGISLSEYLRHEGSCGKTRSFDCYADSKNAYLNNLERGFLLPNRSFHPALSYVVAINEPDLTLPGLDDPRHFARSVASAIDGMLDAEKVANVTGPRPNVTVCLSFAFCPKCTQLGDLPGLGQMWMIRDAMQNPGSYGYAAKNDLREFYVTRFTNSFNSKNPSGQIQQLFLRQYETEFNSTPVFVSEYHQPNNPDTKMDLLSILTLATQSPLLLGVSFFEFQNRHDEEGHTEFGMFDPLEPMPHSNPIRLSMSFSGRTYQLPCLSPVRETGANQTLPEQISSAYGASSSFDASKMCKPRPDSIGVGPHGFDQVQGLRDWLGMRVFVRRVVRHMGGDLLDDKSIPESFAKDFAFSQATFKNLTWALQLLPRWANWSSASACVVDKGALAAEVSSKIKYTCGLGEADCSRIPTHCQGDLWNTATYVFGSHFKTLALKQGALPDPFLECFMEGTARFSSPRNYESSGILPECVVPVGMLGVDADVVLVGPRSFEMVSAADNATAMAHFIRRTVRRLGGDVPNSDSVPKEFAQQFLGRGRSFEALVDSLAWRPSWASWSPRAACVADPKASKRQLGKAIGSVCSKGSVDCTRIPVECKRNLQSHASFVFGSQFASVAARKHISLMRAAISNCTLDGAARFASPAVYKRYGLIDSCVVHIDANLS
eukprot:TRINITY_DN12358_c0_g1_i1.p1 TRINITY_DN12358_c0_g1~~TRINITY_DN12358_c0_g1_i1.p1  ORF type:complete len:801 (-),score=93.16 TRINITY_DN12358_c0_g1_i1:108-2510(-)